VSCNEIERVEFIFPEQNLSFEEGKSAKKINKAVHFCDITIKAFRNVTSASKMIKVDDFCGK